MLYFIKYITENMYVMLKNLMIYYEELKNSFEKNGGDYLFVLKNHYRILLFLIYLRVFLIDI